MTNFTYMKDKDFSNGRQYIGASDFPTLAGVNDYQTPYEFWEVFTGRKESFKGNFISAEGHIKEAGILAKKLAHEMLLNDYGPDYTADHWIKALNTDFIRNFVVSRLWEENEYQGLHSWTEAIFPTEEKRLKGRICAHADLLDLRYEISMITQAKNTGVYAANTRKRNPYKGYSREDLSQNGIPIGVYLQEIAETMCYGIPSAYVAVEIGGNEWNCYGPVQYRKKDAEKLIILADRMLWHVDNDKPPTPKTWPDITSMFPDLEKATKSTVSGQDELDAKKIISEIARIDDKRRLLEKAKLDRIMGLSLFACEPDLGVMHNYLTASDGTKLASFSEKVGQWRISVSRLKTEYPDKYKELDDMGLITQDSSSRSIYISGANAGTVDLFTLISYDYDGSNPKPSRKKYDKAEKKAYSAFCKSVGLKIDWERYSTK